MMWSILMPTVPKRAAQFEMVLNELLGQIEDAGAPDVKVIAWLNEGAPRLGIIRDRMVHYALALGFDYVSFVDDDDMVSPSFVQRIRPALADQPDHVGFQVRYFKDGAFKGICDHSLRHKTWRVEGGPGEPGYRILRDFTHIDPVRASLAARGRFAEAATGQAEDRKWVRQVRPHLKTEAYIDEVMYDYRWVPAQSTWDARGKARSADHPPIRTSITSPHLLWHPESL